MDCIRCEQPATITLDRGGDRAGFCGEDHLVDALRPRWFVRAFAATVVMAAVGFGVGLFL